jgi:hypothetical protein
MMARAYLRGLQRLYTFTFAIPASLTASSYERESTTLFKFHRWPYFLLRLGATFLILTVIGSALLMQARLLGIITSVDPRRRAEERRLPSPSHDGQASEPAHPPTIYPTSLHPQRGG